MTHSAMDPKKLVIPWRKHKKRYVPVAGSPCEIDTLFDVDDVDLVPGQEAPTSSSSGLFRSLVSCLEGVWYVIIPSRRKERRRTGAKLLLGKKLLVAEERVALIEARLSNVRREIHCSEKTRTALTPLLRRRKQCENQYKQAMLHQNEIEHYIDLFERQDEQADLVEAMKEVTRVVRPNAIDVEVAEDLKLSMVEINDDANELNEVLSTPWHSDDQSDIEDELNALLMTSEPPPPSPPTLPLAPTLPPFPYPPTGTPTALAKAPSAPLPGCSAVAAASPEHG